MVADGYFRNSKEIGWWVFRGNDGNRIERPKNFHIDIMDDDESVNGVGHSNKGNNMNEIYISLHWTVALALLVLLPLLGAGVARFLMKRKKGA